MARKKGMKKGGGRVPDMMSKMTTHKTTAKGKGKRGKKRG